MKRHIQNVCSSTIHNNERGNDPTIHQQGDRKISPTNSYHQILQGVKIHKPDLRS